MTGFFAPPPPRPESQPEAQPEWMGPPDDVLPGVVPVELLLARTDETAVALSGLRAYPNGIDFTVVVLLRDDVDQGLDPFLHRGAVTRDGRLRDEVLRLGVQFADGRRATNVGRAWPEDGSAPEPPVLLEGGGGGGGHRWDLHHWLWPLPPPGPLVFVVEWPVRGIAEMRVEMDAGAVREAAGRSRRLWP